MISSSDSRPSTIIQKPWISPQFSIAGINLVINAILVWRRVIAAVDAALWHLKPFYSNDNRMLYKSIWYLFRKTEDTRMYYRGLIFTTWHNSNTFHGYSIHLSVAKFYRWTDAWINEIYWFCIWLKSKRKASILHYDSFVSLYPLKEQNRWPCQLPREMQSSFKWCNGSDGALNLPQNWGL